MCSIVELYPQDDLASVRQKLSCRDLGRVLLILPWDLRFLSRKLDFDLLRREAERWQLEVAIVSADPERRGLARGCGFPAFAGTEEAQGQTAWRGHAPESVEPPPRYWWDEEIDLRPRPVRSRATWLNWARLGVRLSVFLLAVLIIAGSAYAIVPSSVVTLVPAGKVFTTIVPVSVDLEAEAIDHATGVIPAKRVGIEVEGYIEVETTGNMNVFAGRAIGTVIFTNLLAQNYVVPAGTVVRTSSTSYPIRFRTTSDVAVPAGGQVAAPIEALEDRVGNVGAFQINQVEGVAASAVRVINPEPTTGAEARETRVVAQADYDLARSLLMSQLFDQAFEEMGYLPLLEPTEFILRQSLRIEAVPKQAYNRFVTEQADSVGLNMRLLVSGWAVDADNAEAVAFAVLSRRIPPGYKLLSASFELGEEAEEDIGPGSFAFFVTASGYADATLDAGEAVSLVRGQRVADARERLLAEFPLIKEPHITLWPEWPEGLKWLERMPLIPLRINVQVVPQRQEAAVATP